MRLQTLRTSVIRMHGGGEYASPPLPPPCRIFLFFSLSHDAAAALSSPPPAGPPAPPPSATHTGPIPAHRHLLHLHAPSHTTMRLPPHHDPTRSVAQRGRRGRPARAAESRVGAAAARSDADLRCAAAARSCDGPCATIKLLEQTQLAPRCCSRSDGEQRMDGRRTRRHVAAWLAGHLPQTATGSHAQWSAGRARTSRCGSRRRSDDARSAASQRALV